MGETALHKIRILIVIPTLQCGGSEKYVSLLCNNTGNPQMEITLVVLDNSRPFYTISNPSVTVIDLRTKQVRHSFFKLRAIIKKTGPHIIYSNANHLNLYFAIFKNLLAPGAVLVARESSIVSVNSRRAKWPVLYNRLIKYFYKRLDCIVCQSAYMQQDLLDNYHIKKEQTIVINNMVRAREKYAAALQPGKFISVSRLSEEKGVERLIEAVSLLQFPFSYHVIGDGPQMPALKELVARHQLQDKVFLHGEKSDPYAGMEDAQLFLMGSYYEGFPNSLLEAGSLGIPVVAFDVPGGIKEIVTEGKNGVMVKDNNSRDFANAVKKAITIPFNRQQIKEDTLNGFSINAGINKTENLFIQLYKKSKMNTPV